MPNHVTLIEVDKSQSFDALQYVNRFEQTAAPGIGQVDLSDVAGDHRLGIKSQTGDEHFHLLRSSILGFIQNHKGIVQSAATHECDRRNLDDIFLQVAIDLLRIKHVVERVIK